MSSNDTYTCYYCKNKIESIIKDLYGKLPKEVYDKLKESDDLDEFLELIPDEYKDWINGDTGRIEGSSLDFDFFETWGEAPFINEEGNMIFHVSGSCDLCGKGFQYKIILPENGDGSPEKVIDLTKGKYEKFAKIKSTDVKDGGKVTE